MINAVSTVILVDPTVRDRRRSASPSKASTGDTQPATGGTTGDDTPIATSLTLRAHRYRTCSNYVIHICTVYLRHILNMVVL